MPDSLCIVVISTGETMMQYTHISAIPSSSTTTISSKSHPSSSSSVPNNCIFEEFRVEHKKNVIPLAFAVENLIHGFNPVNDTTNQQLIDIIVLKLVKRGLSPYLSIESRSPSGTVIMTHDIPAKLLPPEISERYSAPRLPLPHVRMLLPDPNRLVAILDRMKSFGKYVTLSGDMGQAWWSNHSNAHSSSDTPSSSSFVPSKEENTANKYGTSTTTAGASLVVSISNESASMQTFFRNLSSEALYPSSTESPPLAPGAGTATAVVACRDFLRVLKGINIFSPILRDSWLFGMIRTRAIFLHLQLEDGLSSITYIHSVIENGTMDNEQESNEDGTTVQPQPNI